MNRLTTNKEVSEMGMVELAYNSCFAKNGEAYYRDFEKELSARDFARNLYKRYANVSMPEDMDELDECLLDDLTFDVDEDIAGLLALFYRNLWAQADIYERLKGYEDAEEQGLLLRIGREGYLVHDNHIDKMELQYIDFDNPELLYRYKGICEDDELPFFITLGLKDIENNILSKEEAEAALKEMEK